MALTDSIRDRWEQMAPRERKLAVMFAGALLLCIAVFVARGITAGLTTLEENNEAKRDALMALARYRAGDVAKASSVKIPDVAVKLSRYVDGIITTAGIESPSYPQPKETERGAFVEHSFSLKLPKLTIVQLKDFLEKLETNSKTVVVKNLKIKRNFRDKEKLDVELVIATYSKKTKKDSDSGDSTDGDNG